MTTYNAVANLRVPSQVSAVLKEMSRQEGRHMRFYKEGAMAVFRQYPGARSFVRAVVRKTWRPVGIDLLGLSQWKEVIAPIISLDFPARFTQVDEIAERILGAPMPVMAAFLDRNNMSPAVSRASMRQVPLRA